MNHETSPIQEAVHYQTQPILDRLGDAQYQTILYKRNVTIMFWALVILGLFSVTAIILSVLSFFNISSSGTSTKSSSSSSYSSDPNNNSQPTSNSFSSDQPWSFRLLDDHLEINHQDKTQPVIILNKDSLLSVLKVNTAEIQTDGADLILTHPNLSEPTLKNATAEFLALSVQDQKHVLDAWEIYPNSRAYNEWKTKQIKSSSGALDLIEKRMCHHSDVVNILDFGAKTDATEDAGPAIRAAFATLTAQGGGTLYAPPGHYLIDSPVIFDSSIRFVGAGRSESNITPDSNIVDRPGKGTWFICNNTSIVPFTTANGHGMIVDLENFSCFQNHGIPYSHVNPNWTPNTYQPFILCKGTANIRYVTFLTCDKGIQCDAGRVVVEHVCGEFWSYGIYCRQATDQVRINNFNAGLYWAGGSEIAAQYHIDHSIGILSERSDNPQMMNVGCHAYYAGIHFSYFSDSSGYVGPTGGCSIVNLQTDSCKYGIYVTGDNTNFHLNGWIHASGTPYPITGSTYLDGGNGMLISGASNVRITISQFTFYYIEQAAFQISGGSGNIVKIRDGSVKDFDTKSAGYGAITVSAGVSSPHYVYTSGVSLEGSFGSLTQSASGTSRIMDLGVRSTNPAQPSNCVGHTDTGFYNPSSSTLGIAAGGQGVANFQSNYIYLGGDAINKPYALRVETPASTDVGVVVSGNTSGNHPVISANSIAGATTNLVLKGSTASASTILRSDTTDTLTTDTTDNTKCQTSTSTSAPALYVKQLSSSAVPLLRIASTNTGSATSGFLANGTITAAATPSHYICVTVDDVGTRYIPLFAAV